MKILFIDSTHTLLKKNLEKQNHSCDTAYHKSKEEIEKTISNYEGIIIRSRFEIDQIFRRLYSVQLTLCSYLLYHAY